MMKSLDCETNGRDLRHGVRPFIVTMCNEELVNSTWVWQVDPLTRQPIVPDGDLDEIEEEIDEADILAFHNAKFDIPALENLETDDWKWKPWDWSKIIDSLFSGHVLGSSDKHDLTSQALIHLDKRIEPIEKELKKAVNHARTIARSKYPRWAIASEGRPDMPSAKESLTGFDYWLPKEIARHEGYKEHHPWHTVATRYADTDSVVTLLLNKCHLEKLERLGLLEIYYERLKSARISYKMEKYGVTISKERQQERIKSFREISKENGERCVKIARSYGFDLQLPKGGNNKSLTSFAFDADKLNLPVVRKSKKTKKPSFDAKALDIYDVKLPPKGKPALFIRSLKRKRKFDTAISYLESYERFWIPVKGVVNRKGEQLCQLWCRLHPSLNPTGTATLRWSSSQPNEQNISKKNEANLRYCFGPMPGREWWSLDAKNLELRIPAFEANEREMCDLFNRMNDPPYYGSYHLLIFDTLHPKLFAKDGVKCKDIYESTWYQWTKNGNFAVQYGAQESSGTADAAYHVPGAQRMIGERFPAIKRLNDLQVAFANNHGYVETIRDKELGFKRGYPMTCRTQWGGRVKPTVPLSYHIQGTAMQWMARAMVKCDAYLDSITLDAHMVMNIHDEIVYDFPSGKGDRPWETNLPHIRKIQGLMESCGKAIDVPTPVSVEYHRSSWDRVEWSG
jgi:DNA polymerase-1